MNVLIDGTVLLGARGGVRRYVSGLTAALPRLDRSNRYTLLFRTFRGDRKAALHRLVESGEVPRDAVRRLNVPERILGCFWHTWSLPLPWSRSLLGAGDVFVDSWYLAPRLRTTRLVAIVYDLLPLKVPEFYPVYHDAFRRRITTVVERASMLVAISETTKRDLEFHCGVPPERIRVVHPGIESRFCPDGAAQLDQRVLQRYGIRGPYVLYVGSAHPNKQVPRLMEAWTLLRRRGVHHALVRCGSPPDASDRSREQGQTAHADVINTGFVPDEYLPTLYRGASAFVFVPAYEGFGLPPVEAMSSGVPVVVSDTPAIRESVGEAGLYVNPHQPQEVADALERLLTDETLRRTQTARGLERARCFTWTRSAHQMLQVLQDVA